uniref:cullin-1-like n=1 Tax=Erigeron canadensis TaxID=72917 RepID=UPI001CB8ECBA|nr:cullin-1-like [Erigeron canadensis]
MVDLTCEFRKVPIRIRHFRKRWDLIEANIMKILYDSQEPHFGILAPMIKDMIKNGEFDHSERLYTEYMLLLEVYLESTVLPSLQEKRDELLLEELQSRWSDYKIKMERLSRDLIDLDHYYTCKNKDVLTVEMAGYKLFRDLVYGNLKKNVMRPVMALINQEREGQQIDQAILKSTLDLVVEMNFGLLGCYENDFEAPLLEETAAYYSRKASNWIEEYSCLEYMLQAEVCLKREKERVTHYLQSSTETKLLEKVRNELLTARSAELIKKKETDIYALLRDHKVDDLSRMHKLLRTIPHALDPHVINCVVLQHVTAEGTALVNQAEDAANNKMIDVAGMQEQVFYRKVINLHNKCMVVVDCFDNQIPFHKAVKDAFEIFCDRSIFGSSSAESLAKFSDKILKKGGTEQLSDEAIEDTLDEIVKLLRYISAKDVFVDFCWKKLSRRLLFDRSISDEHERSFVAKLKEWFGVVFTRKMEATVIYSCIRYRCIYGGVWIQYLLLVFIKPIYTKRYITSTTAPSPILHIYPSCQPTCFFNFWD